MTTDFLDFVDFFLEYNITHICCVAYINIISALQLQEYQQLFHENEDIAWIAKIDKRYAWLKRHLLDFEDRLGKIFPIDWEVSERITVQFCIYTRDSLKPIMQRRRSEIDVKLLLFAISKTQQFELLLAKRFTGETIFHRALPNINKLSQKPNEKEISKSASTIVNVLDNNTNVTEIETIQSPFINLIAICFMPFLDIYTDSVDRNLSEIIERFVHEGNLKIDPVANNSTVLPRYVIMSSFQMYILFIHFYYCTQLRGSLRFL